MRSGGDVGNDLGPTDSDIGTVAGCAALFHGFPQALIEAGRLQGIQLSPLSRYFTGPATRAGLVLGYAGSHEQDLARAGDWLARAWQRL